MHPYGVSGKVWRQGRLGLLGRLWVGQGRLWRQTFLYGSIYLERTSILGVAVNAFVLKKKRY
jgi:hypothetical protein